MQFESVGHVTYPQLAVYLGERCSFSVDRIPPFVYRTVVIFGAMKVPAAVVLIVIV